MKAPNHPRQAERLQALQKFGILDTPREADFDAIVALASKICGAPVSVINLIDADRQWFKAEVGLGVRETPLDTSLCSHAILTEDFTEIPDTLADRRMQDNPLCMSDPGFRFYAGALLRTSEGLPLGTLCVLDTAPRRLNALQVETLQVLASQVMTQLELRLALQRQEALRKEGDHRVKNSLAMIAGLVRIQARASGLPETKEALRIVSQRIETVAVLHGLIYQSEDDGLIDLSDYMQKVGQLLMGAKPDHIDLGWAFAPVRTDSATAAAAAVVINELCTNAFKHAFPDGRPGGVTITGTVVPEGYALLVVDNGIGQSAPAAAPGGIGTAIVDATIRERGGCLDRLQTESGCHITVILPV